MKAPNSILQNYLIDNGMFNEPALASNWALYIGYLPENDYSNVAAILNIEPQKDGRYMGDGTVFQHYGCELQARSSDYEVGWNKMTDVEILFSQTVNEIVNATEDYKIHSITNESGIVSLGIDERRRNYFVMRLLLSLSVV